jgi:hypothetical protein
VILACPDCGKPLRRLVAWHRLACDACGSTFREDDFACTHPPERIVPLFGSPGKSRCEQCGATGKVMTRGPLGILLPKANGTPVLK